MLPPPSAEQGRVLEQFRAGRNLVVTAVAGAGKSTLLLHTCAAFPDDQVIILAYNAPLAAEMNELLQAAGLVNATAYTFHSLASQVFRLCPDDNTMYEIVEEAHKGGTQPRTFLSPQHLLLDEMQDMRHLYWELLNITFDLKTTHTLLCGDPEQMLYDFELDDPARLDFLQRPGDFFGSGEWVHERLSVSFRLTPPVASMVNAVKDGEPLVAGNASSVAPPPLVITCGMFEWTPKLLPIVRSWLQSYPPSKIAILARTVRTAHPAVRSFVNALVAAGVPIYVHGVDAAHSQVRLGKVTVATYYAAKGLTFEACITLGAAEGVEPNPMYVAVSRSRCRQVVVLDRMRPPKRIIGGIRDHSVQAMGCAHTKRLVMYGTKEAPEAPRGSQSLVDVTHWEPRGRAPDVHAAISTSVVSMCDDVCLPAETFAEYGDAQEEVSDVYVLAALMCEEFEATGRCQRLSQLFAPQKACLKERTKRAREGDGTRLVDDRTKNDELFPEALRDIVRKLHGGVHVSSLLACTTCPEGGGGCETRCGDDARGAPATHVTAAKKWCAAALASTAFGNYHHRAKRLLACLDWIDEALFETLRSRLRTTCLSKAHTASFDHMVRHIGSQTVTQYRCPVLTDDHTSWLFVHVDHIGPNVRARACVPAAVTDEVHTCCVVNMRTGETHSYRVSDREPLRQRMELA